jgi:poly-beta-1,6-N-acetyl-D-glucosamine N-deacetylase
MNFYRKFLFYILYLSGIPLLIRELVQKKQVTIIFYHNPGSDFFENHIRELLKRYNIIPLKQYIDAQKNGDINELPKKSLIITIDDGNYQNFDLLPIIKKYNIPVTIFLCSGLIGTYRQFWFRSGISLIEREEMKKISDEKRISLLMKHGFYEKKNYEKRHTLSKNEIEEMKKYVDFQSHTIFHPILTTCSDQRSFEEISKSKKDLETDYNLNIYAICYPNGDYSDREIKIASHEGYKCGLTSNPGFNTINTDIFQLKRISINDNVSISELIVRTSGFWSMLKHFFMQKI